MMNEPPLFLDLEYYIFANLQLWPFKYHQNFNLFFNKNRIFVKYFVGKLCDFNTNVIFFGHPIAMQDRHEIKLGKMI